MGFGLISLCMKNFPVFFFFFLLRQLCCVVQCEANYFSIRCYPLTSEILQCGSLGDFKAETVFITVITKCLMTSKYPMRARAYGETFLHYNRSIIYPVGGVSNQLDCQR